MIIKKTTLQNLCDFLNGFAFKSKNYVNTGIRVIRIANVQKGKIVDTDPCFYPRETEGDIKKYLLVENDLLISLTGNVGRVGLLSSALLPAALNQRVSCLRIKNYQEVFPKFLFYYFQQNSFENACIQASSGVAQLNLSTKWLEKYEIQLPSLPKQKRIVQKIEELFAELDKGVEELEQAKARLKVYRQAVLKEAFEGKLTVACRKNNTLATPSEDFSRLKTVYTSFKDISGDNSLPKLFIPDSWRTIRFGDIFHVEVGSTPNRRNDEYWMGKIPWVSSGEVKFSTIYKTKENITELGLVNSSTKLQKKGTVLLAMIGEGKTRGKAAILEVDSAHNQNTAAILIPETPCSSKYIFYYLMMIYDYTRHIGSGNNQKALNKERVKAIKFPFTSFYEQHEIALAIDEKFSTCDKQEQIINESLQKAESLRQSILKQAFEGRLV